ncbi:TIGR01777 family oxidoreductase [Microbacterium sp. CIAB417]|uniref:TIGR01777 family oxidoreductase n=1 Tax=Microbacterium sp. CIAB417 TaxID=2860287 RepID=UPI001FAC539A|nr:TIGR01777 family oxidoreductase [Microbacterium sp. CIAB417]
MRILLVGASGLIGSAVAARAGGVHEVRALVRRDPVDASEHRWDASARTAPAEPIAWADAVISLSGASLSRLPWTARYRAEILRSRVAATSAIARAIAGSEAPPDAWVSASAVGIYGDRPGEVVTEDAMPGTGFLADVVGAWESAADPARPRTRVVHARTGLVLASGGALTPLMLTTRLGLGATIGGGSQHWPWISLEDEAAALLHLATASALDGPVNLVGPAPATSRDITRGLARVLHRPHLFRLPAFALRAGMGIAADELLLADQQAVPERLIRDGFAFRHATPDAALRALVR